MDSPEFGGEGLPEKVLGLHRTFTEQGIPHGFGGAIALAYHAEPRATDDIDVNILLSPDRASEVMTALDTLFATPDRGRELHKIATRDQTRLKWGETYVDLFFMDTAFHESLATRVESVGFGDTNIPIVSAEDLVVCKALFNRPHDWTDIQRIYLIQDGSLDRHYVRNWLQYFVGESDPILERIDNIEAGQKGA
jgi:predicted nucleotidyltransferase